MTKEEKIKEAWGNYYPTFKENIDSDGWLDSAWLDDMELEYCVKDGYDRYGTKSSFIRPISLLDIENNNGWIKIESEEDLPKKDGKYLTHRANGIITEEYFHIKYRYAWQKFYSVTHYQPIEKPKPPIY